MKCIKIILFFFPLMVIHSYSQQGFNRAYSFNGRTAVFMDALYDNGYIYVSADITDTVSPVRDVPAVLKVDMNGNVLDTVYEKLSYTYLFTPKRLVHKSSGEFMIPGAFSSAHALVCSYKADTLAGYYVFTDTTAQANIIKDMIYHTDHCYYITLLNQELSYVINTVVIKLDSTFNTIWVHEYGTTIFSEFPSCMESLDDGTIIIGSSKSNFGFAPVGSEMYARTWFFRIDTAGNILQEWQHDDVDSYLAGQIVQTPGGGYAYCGAHVSYRYSDDCYLLSYVQKLDQHLTPEWDIVLNNAATFTSLTDLKVKDGLLYIVGSEGDSVYVDPEDVYNQHYYGVLYVIDLGGNVKYKKYFTLPESLRNLPGIHSPYPVLYSIDFINDTTLIMAGEVQIYFSPYNPTIPPQYGWLIKTNLEGCITSHCDFVGMEEQDPEGGMLVYPNPAVETLRLEVGENLLHSTFYITDVQGRLIQHGYIVSPVTVFDVTAYRSGIYFIRLEKEGKNEVRKFIK